MPLFIHTEEIGGFVRRREEMLRYRSFVRLYAIDGQARILETTRCAPGHKTSPNARARGVGEGGILRERCGMDVSKL